MKKYLILISSVLFSIILSCQTAFALTQQEADEYNNLYYPQSVYNGGINAAPQGTTQDGYVNTATGSTNIKVIDLTLPGVNGFDLNISRTYSSTNASLFEAYLKETDIPYDAPYYMITGSKRIYIYYTNSSWNSTPYDDICLTPDFETYLDEKDAEWMVKNKTKYEYDYVDNPAKSKLFTSYSEAKAMVDYINSTSYEIDAYFPYDNTVDYEIDYYDFKVVTVWKTDYRTDYTDGLLDDTATERYSKLGAGWEFDFPYVETRYGYDHTYEYLHFGDKGVWLVDFSDGGDNNLSGYPINDIKLVRDTSLTHDGMHSKYRVDEKDGTKHYFGTDGRLLIQQDRHGNQIKFYCDTESYMNVWGDYKDYPYIQKIVDTLGREVIFTFEYDEDDNITMYMTITNPSDITDVKQYTYFLDKLNNSQIGITSYDEGKELECDEWVLKKVTDPVGRYYSYNYDYLKTKFAFLDKNDTFYLEYYDWTNSSKGNSYIDDDNFEEFSGIHNTYALLKSATKAGEKSYYFKYAPFIKNCTPNGSMMFYKVYRSYEESADSYTGDRYYLNDKTYNYDINEVGEYDGYINYDYDDRVSSSYNYAVKVTDENSPTGKTAHKIYKYTYLGAEREKTILLTKLTEQGTDHKIITDYSYDSDTKLVTGVTYKNYSVSNNSNYMTTSKTYTYGTGNYADILTETPNNTSDRAVTYTYDSTYHFPLTKTYKQDANTTIREEYVPTSDGKKIEFLNIYVNDVLKSKIQYSHDSYGNIVNQKAYSDSSNYVETEYTYQNGAYVINEKIKQVVNNDNVVSDVSISSTYNYWGCPVTQTDGNGNTATYEYDEISRVTKITNPDDTYKEYYYSTWYTREDDELDNRIINYHNAEGESNCIRYNSFGVDYNCRYFNSFGQLETEVIYTDDYNDEGYQIEQCRTQYFYDTYQRPIVKEVYDSSNTLIYKETYSYDITADYVKETTTVIGDENNPSVITSVYYNKYGNKIKTEIGNDVETYTSDYAGNILTVKSAKVNSENSNNVRTAEYNFMGKVTRETDELGNITSAEYDWLGRMTKSYDAKGYATEFTYDNLGRVIEQKTPFEEDDGTIYYSIKKIWYDNNGNVIKERVSTNAPGEADSYNEVIYTYDNRNRLIMTQANDGEMLNYTQNYYDATGNLLRVYTGLHAPLTINGLDDVTGTDTEYAVTKYTYDELKRLLTTTDALGQVETNTYDVANGLLETTTDRNGQTFNFTYNGLGSITSKALSDGTKAETTTYGLTGQVLSKQNETTSISYVYNDKGQLMSESNSAAGTIKSFTYDANGNSTGFTLTRNGATEISQSYTYDLLNRLTSVSENGAVIASYSYDANDNRTQTTVTGGETTNYSYNIANMLTSQTTGDKFSEQYTYYLNGNQKTKTSNGITITYEYDKMNRLISENDTDYSFDDFGNRILMTDGTVTTNYTYDLNNRLSESVEVNGDITTNTKFFYDNNGNQITKATMINQPYAEGMSGDYAISDSTNNYIALYEYNCYNQLVGVDTNGVVSSYSYSPDGLRHSKTVGGNTTIFAYDNANVIEEITADGTNKYYRGIEIIKNNNDLYYLYNGQGDVSLLIDNAGTTVADYVFDAYGNQSEQNTIYNPFGYRGEYTDAESGLIYLRARMYDPLTGRFINEDPIQDGLNWYVYCENNPILFIDMFGLAPTPEEAAYIAEHVYKHDKDSSYTDRQVKYEDGTLLGWRMIDSRMGREGMKMGFYIPEGDDWQNPSEYVVAFKGTTLLDLGDWKNNAEQLLSPKSADMWDAINYGTEFVNAKSGYEITFVGHSKGGAEAASTATATNRSAIIFNPATSNLSAYGLSSSNYTASMKAFIVKGDIVNTAEGWFSRPIDEMVMLPQQHGGKWHDLWQTSLYQSIQNHLMDAVKEALREDGY